MEKRDALFARAEAAAAEAKRLVEINWEWQRRTSAAIRRMQLRVIFEPLARRIMYLEDVREQLRPPYQPFPSQADDE